MNVKNAYNVWAHQYDTNKNRTRDLEALSLKSSLADFNFQHCLEIGCGTGKNTQWLLNKAQRVTAVDFSEEMLAKVREKINAENVTFIQADILQEWNFTESLFDFITFSLVLEHIKDLNKVFAKASAVLKPGGIIYIGELHPFKQYLGTKARFETDAGLQEVTCFTHHISDFTEAAKNNGFKLLELKEYFDDAEEKSIPRILSLLFRNQQI